MASSTTVNVFFSLRVPADLMQALVDLQKEHRDLVDPQAREHLHITLGFLHQADAGHLADAAALISSTTWPTPSIRLTGEVRHGSWALQKNPDYHYRDDLVQKGEQVRLGIEFTPELREIQAGITQRLDITEDGYWPHVTLGLARSDLPRTDAEAMHLPTLNAPLPRPGHATGNHRHRLPHPDQPPPHLTQQSTPRTGSRSVSTGASSTPTATSSR
ncbi:2'-5' RNA ligase family protein [Streptomyces flaveolus]|uniref:2'-5' RNA ligase family protein n=1 Tax=Streptomyces flaveolus TaxID=67297 RepID=UPI0036FB1408